jgi:hypothetical protein
MVHVKMSICGLYISQANRCQEREVQSVKSEITIDLTLIFSQMDIRNTHKRRAFSLCEESLESHLHRMA